MLKTIQISECKTTVSETQKLNLRELGCKELTKTTGYPCIIIGDTMYYDKDFNIKDELTVLVNGRAPISKDCNEYDITLDIPDKMSEETMPEFGLTISDNINVIQTNVDLDDMVKYLEKSVLNYWGTDKHLHSGYNSYSQEEIQDTIRQIAKYGYVAPVAIVCDAMFKPEQFSYIYALYQLMGKNTLPIRVVCYKDYKYVSKLCKSAYQAIKKVPANQYFTPLDNEDYTGDFIWNYSDKRAVFDMFKARTPMMLKDARPFDRKAWKPEYYIIKGQEGNVRDLVYQIKQHEANTVIGESKYQEDTPYVREARSYLDGFEHVIKTDDAEEWELLLPETADNFEVYKEADKLDTADLSLKRLSYHHECDKEVNQLLKKFDADLIIMGDRFGSVIGFKNMHNLINKEHIKVKYIRHKR